MAQVSTSAREVEAKIVYYGPALCGKTTNLESIHATTDPEGHTRLVCINTEGDRTLFFDLLPFDLGTIIGYRVRLKLYATPGQVQYDRTRRLVLTGADGVVFVADSHPSKLDENLQSLEQLRRHMRALGMEPGRVPVVIQWNKRDLPDALPTAELRRALGVGDEPCHEAVAVEGQGVIETLREVVQAGLLELGRRFGMTKRPEDARRLQLQVQRTFERFSPVAPRRVDSQPKPATQSSATEPTAEEVQQLGILLDEQPPRAAEKLVITMDNDDLLAASVESAMRFGEEAALTNQVGRSLNERERAVERLARLTSGLKEAVDADDVVKRLLSGLLDLTEAPLGSVLFAQQGKTVLEERLVLGSTHDPLNSIPVKGVGSLAYLLFRRREARSIADPEAELMAGEAHPGLYGITAALVVPLAARNLALGAVHLYHTEVGKGFESQQVNLVRLAADHAYSCIIAAMLARKLSLVEAGTSPALA